MSSSTNVFSVPGGNIFPSATSGFRQMRAGILNADNVAGQQSLASAPSALQKPKGVQNALQNTPTSPVQTGTNMKLSQHSSGNDHFPDSQTQTGGGESLLAKLASEFGPQEKTAVLGSAFRLASSGLKRVMPHTHGALSGMKNRYAQSGFGKAIGNNLSLSGAGQGLEAGMGADVATSFLTGSDETDGYGTLGGLALGALSPRLRRIANVPGFRWTGGQTVRNAWNGVPRGESNTILGSFGLRRGLNTAGYYGLAGGIQEAFTGGEFNMARPIQSMRAAADRQAQMAGFQSADEMRYVAQQVKENPESRAQFFSRLARLAM